MPKKGKKSEKRDLAVIEREMSRKIEDFQRLRGGIPCYPLLLPDMMITGSLVDDVYSDLRDGFGENTERLDVIVNSPGGDIDSAYNLATLFRKFGTSQLTFVVPRWAKSAATLMVCAGDSILMTPVAELGPIDPVITEINPHEGRFEQYSPLHLDATMNLIRAEYRDGNKNLADKLTERLQFPMTLGSIIKSLDIGHQYIKELLSSRMLRGRPKKEIDEVAKRLIEGYADHGFCIKLEEAVKIGLRVVGLEEDQLKVVWDVERLLHEKRKLEQARRQKQIQKQLEELPPDLLRSLPDQLR